MRWVRDGCKHLGCSNIRPAEHSDAAIGVWQRSGPFDCVVAIIRFVLERVPLAFRGVATAHILKDDDITAGGGLQPKRYAIVFVVRSALQQNGKLAVGVGAKD